MNKPQRNDWDRFWSPARSKKYGSMSWSKRRVMSVLEPYLAPGCSVLDAGCGSGFYSKHFIDMGMEVVSLDYSANALKKVRDLTGGKTRIVKGDLLECELNDLLGKKFSLIFSDGLFEHFNNNGQDIILRNMMSVLNEQGTIFTVVPNVYSPWQLMRPFLMPGITETPFRLNEARELHRRNGLTVQASGGLNVVPFYVSPERMLGRAFGMLLYVAAEK